MRMRIPGGRVNKRVASAQGEAAGQLENWRTDKWRTGEKWTEERARGLHRKRKGMREERDDSLRGGGGAEGRGPRAQD